MNFRKKKFVRVLAWFMIFNLNLSPLMQIASVVDASGISTRMLGLWYNITHLTSKADVSDGEKYNIVDKV